MIGIFVRSKRDADAVKAMLRTFYNDWDIEIRTLHGSRTIDKVFEEIISVVKPDKYYIVLLGREDRGLAYELTNMLPPNIVVHVVPGKRVRNVRIDRLAYEFAVARSIFRLAVGWSNEYNSFLIGPYRGLKLEEYEYIPAYDVFFGFGEHYYKILSKIIGSTPCKNPLLVRKFGGLHDLYCGIKKYAEIHVFDEGIHPIGRVVNDREVDEIGLSKLLLLNKDIIELYEKIVVSQLEKYRDWADTVIVPWSGGKDSTTVLWIARKIFSPKKIKAIYVDTGVEFPQTREYVYDMARRLGVELYTVYAGIDKVLLEDKMPLPTHDNRWCTSLKISVLEEKINEIREGNTLIITGDRDAESSRRSSRPPTRKNLSDTIIVSPLKLWGTAHIQLYMFIEKIPVNPLYNLGFYRIGCYICPALRSWELCIMLNTPELRNRLSNLKLYKNFIKHRLAMK